jgi:hypothetical protein
MRPSTKKHKKSKPLKVGEKQTVANMSDGLLARVKKDMPPAD